MTPGGLEPRRHPFSRPSAIPPGLSSTKLSDGKSRSIASLSGDTRLTRQAVTKHLRVLERAGLVSSARIGRESRFAYEQKPVDEAKTYLDAVSVRWDAALSRLRSLVEG